jgi:ribosomal protein L20
LKTANVGLDRKVLADLAVSDPQGFAHIVRMALPQA